MDTQELIHAYVSRMLEDMDCKTLFGLAQMYMESHYEHYSEEKLIEEIGYYYPELLEEFSN